MGGVNIGGVSNGRGGRGGVSSGRGSGRGEQWEGRGEQWEGVHIHPRKLQMQTEKGWEG